MHLINLDVPEDYGTELIETRLSTEVEVQFWLYTKCNKNHFEELHVNLTEVKNYNPSKPLVMVTHGWLGSGYSNGTQLIKDAYLATRDVNVIIVDWKEPASYTNYITSAYLTDSVAEEISDFVLALSKRFELHGTDIHLIGHSLGAHVVGLTGMKLKDKKFIIDRVTGLDPARPFFEFPPFLSGITKDAGSFVNIIHTNSGVLGYESSIGHADFYPNGGDSQPHCCSESEIADSCEHRCAFVYFKEAVYGRKYICTKCESYPDYVAGFCYSNDEQLLGLTTDTARGTYYVTIIY
ncbi:lipase member H-like isoform X2 [Danaus plexippus]|nr:lipase member H-like isoform X2 [Danaus plexippus]XP_061382923.1 lipase member H-like isoform X2 [Danaus plexippus]